MEPVGVDWLAKAASETFELEEATIEGLDELEAESAAIERWQDLRAASDAIEFLRPWKSKKVPI